MDGETELPISNVRVSLYELVGTTAKLLSSKKIGQSNYRFQILPNKKLRLVAEKTGYLKSTYDFDSFDAIDYTHIFSLNKRTTDANLTLTSNESIIKQTTDYTASVGTDNDVIATTPKSNPSNSSSARRNTSNTATASASVSIGVKPKASTAQNKTIYKVQVVAVNVHDINHPRYKHVKNIGTIETEEIANRSVTRVLITDLADKQAAVAIKNQVIKYGFVDAFVVKYEDGQRIGRVR